MVKLRHEYAVPLDVQGVMKIKQSVIVFDYYDPVELLVRLLVCSPLSAREENLCFFPEAGEDLYDFCHGERLQRIHDSVPRGTGVLTAVLFFDEINRDQKGFNTGDGAIIVGGFFRQRVRESTYAKASLATFPEVAFSSVC